MKQLICETCGSAELIKQDGFFVCQICGCKYSIESQQGTAAAGASELRNAFAADDLEDLDKLYQVARNARKTSDSLTAMRNYGIISRRDPNSWEAVFYLAICKTKHIRNLEIGISASNVASSVKQVFTLIKEYVPDEAEKKAAVKEVIEQCYQTATHLTSASNNFYKSLAAGNGIMALTGVRGMIRSAGSTGKALTEHQNRCFNIANIMHCCGNAIESNFGIEDEDYKNHAIWSWEKMLQFDADYKKTNGSHLFNKETLDKYESIVMKHKIDSVASDSDSNNAQEGMANIIVTMKYPNKAFNIDCVLSNGKGFKLSSEQVVKIPVEIGTYSISFNFAGQMFVPKKNKATPEFLVDKDTHIHLTYDTVWGGFKTEIKK